jgi:hypothetical protein
MKMPVERGVLIAIKKEFISTEVTELKTDCEIVWSQINMSGSKNLLIGAYYRSLGTFTN